VRLDDGERLRPTLAIAGTWAAMLTDCAIVHEPRQAKPLERHVEATLFQASTIVDFQELFLDGTDRAVSLIFSPGSVSRFRRSY